MQSLNCTIIDPESYTSDEFVQYKKIYNMAKKVLQEFLNEQKNTITKQGSPQNYSCNTHGCTSSTEYPEYIKQRMTIG